MSDLQISKESQVPSTKLQLLCINYKLFVHQSSIKFTLCNTPKQKDFFQWGNNKLPTFYASFLEWIMFIWQLVSYYVINYNKCIPLSKIISVCDIYIKRKWKLKKLYFFSVTNKSIYYVKWLKKNLRYSLARVTMAENSQSQLHQKSPRCFFLRKP